MLTSSNANDAKNECSNDPSCHMFYQYGGALQQFYACENKALIRASSFGSILYQPEGNKTTAQF